MKTKKITITLAILAFLNVVFSFTNSRNIDTGKELTTFQWKNLKVLPQTISEDSLKGLMRGYNEALGVKCSYCHASDATTKKMDFASDDKKEKGFARHMILMTREINAKNFNWENSKNPELINVVTCTMCHRGNESPTKSLDDTAPLEIKSATQQAAKK